MVLEFVSAALKPLQNFTDLLSGEEYVSVSAIVPVMKHDLQLTRDIKSGVLAYMEEKYQSPATAELLSVCSFLDPRFKLDYMMKEDIADIKARVELEAVDIVTKNKDVTQQQQCATETSRLSPGDSEPLGLLPKRRQLADIFKKAKSSDSLSPEEVVKQEIEGNINYPQPEPDFNPLNRWEVNFANFPTLTVLARKYILVHMCNKCSF